MTSKELISQNCQKFVKGQFFIDNGVKLFLGANGSGECNGQKIEAGINYANFSSGFALVSCHTLNSQFPHKTEKDRFELICEIIIDSDDDYYIISRDKIIAQKINATALMSLEKFKKNNSYLFLDNNTWKNEEHYQEIKDLFVTCPEKCTFLEKIGFPENFDYKDFFVDLEFIEYIIDAKMPDTYDILVVTRMIDNFAPVYSYKELLSIVAKKTIIRCSQFTAIINLLNRLDIRTMQFEPEKLLKEKNYIMFSLFLDLNCQNKYLFFSLDACFEMIIAHAEEIHKYLSEFVTYMRYDKTHRVIGDRFRYTDIYFWSKNFIYLNDKDLFDKCINYSLDNECSWKCVRSIKTCFEDNPFMMGRIEYQKILEKVIEEDLEHSEPFDSIVKEIKERSLNYYPLIKKACGILPSLLFELPSYSNPDTVLPYKNKVQIIKEQAQERAIGKIISHWCNESFIELIKEHINDFKTDDILEIMHAITMLERAEKIKQSAKAPKY